MADRVVTLWTREEVDSGVKVVLGYDAIVELRSQELFRTRAGIEGGL